MSEQTTGKLSEEELEEYRGKYRAYCKTTQRSDFGETLRKLLGHVDYQDAKIERLTKEIDSLKVDPAKRDELIADCHGRFQAGFPEVLRFVWLERGEQFRSGFAAAIEHAFAAGRASAPEVADLQRQLEEVNARLAELTKPTDEQELAKIGAEAHHRHLIEKCGHDPKLMFNWEKWPEASRSANIAATTAVAARVRAPLLQQIAELTAKLLAAESDMNSLITAHETDKSQLIGDRDRLAAELATEKRNHQATAELLGLVSKDAKDKDAELAEAKRGLPEAQAELKTVESAIRISFNGPVGTPEYRHACGVLEAIAKSAAPLTAAEFAELGKVLDAEAAAEKVEPPASERAKLAPSVVLVRGKEYRWKFNGSTAYIELPFTLTPGEVEELHASWQVVKASSEEEAPASEARRFVCPECGGTKYGVFPSKALYCVDRGGCGWRGDWSEIKLPESYKCPKCNRTTHMLLDDGRIRCLTGAFICDDMQCDWVGTWAEVEAAKGEQPSTEKSTTFRCPKCDSKYFRTIRFSTELPRLLQCKGHWSGNIIGEKYKGCSWKGTWDEVRGHGLKQQLAAERQAREAAEQRAEQAERDRDSWKHSFESQNGEIRRLSDEMADHEDAIERLREIGKVIGCDHVGGPDERRQIVNCVEQTVQELEQRAEANGKTIGEESGESCSQCGRANTWHPDCPTCEKIMRLEQRAERLQSRCNEHVAEIEQLIQRVKELGAQLDRENDILRAKNFWRWQGDGNDYPESLTCQVVMTAEQLRGLLQRAEQAEAAAGVMTCFVAEIRRLTYYYVCSHPQTFHGEAKKALDKLDKALATDAGRAAANELRALRAFVKKFDRAICVDEVVMGGGPSTLVRSMREIRSEFDKALAGQGEAAREGR